MKNKSIPSVRSEKESYDFKMSKLIYQKDWKEIRGNKDLLIPMMLVPAMFSIFMPIVLGLSAIYAPEEYGMATAYEALAFMAGMFMKPMFLMIPTIVSMIIASDSFAGEKERKTAETLLVLPITHKELYIGKALAAFIPAFIFSIIAFSMIGIVLNIMVGLSPTGAPPGALPLVFGDISFWIVAFGLGTLFSLMNVQAGIIISSRSKDMKSAQSISGVFVVPILGLVFGSLVNPLLLTDMVYVLILCAIFTVIVYILTILGSKFINRERLIANIG
jgi:ABC-2 type transport system permease protein